MKTLHLKIESPSCLETPPLGAEPFALWDVVDQPLLFHWLDFAVDHRFQRVRISCSDHLVERFRAALSGATLWPIELRVERARDGETADFAVDHLPGFEPLPRSCASAAHWLEWHSKLVERRLAHLWENAVADYPYLARGHRSVVHPTVTLAAPYWIGEGSRIEAGVFFGPGSCIGRSVRIGPGCSLANSSVASGISLAADTHFKSHVIHPGAIFNHASGLILPAATLGGEPDRLAA